MRVLSTGQVGAKSLARMIQEAVDLDVWKGQVALVAGALDIKCPDTIERVEQSVGSEIEGLLLLTKSRNASSDEAMLLILQEWYRERKQTWGDLSQQIQVKLEQQEVLDPSELLSTAVAWRLLGELEFLYERRSVEIQEASESSMASVADEGLNESQVEKAERVVKALKEAHSALSELQEVGEPLFEVDVYLNIMQAALHHFDELVALRERQRKTAA